MTRCTSRKENWGIVQTPVRKPSKDGMSHRGTGDGIGGRRLPCETSWRGIHPRSPPPCACSPTSDCREANHLWAVALSHPDKRPCRGTGNALHAATHSENDSNSRPALLIREYL